MTPNAQEKISLCVAKNTIKQVKTQPIEYKKISKNSVADKRFVSRIKNCYNSIILKIITK